MFRQIRNRPSTRAGTNVGLVVVTANVAVVSAFLAIPDQVAAQTETARRPVAFQGQLPNWATDVGVYAAADEPGATSGPMRSYKIPAEGPIAADHYAARIDPASVPAQVVRSGGLVDFEVIAHGADGRSSTTWITSRIVRVGGRLDWVDPVATSQAEMTSVSAEPLGLSGGRTVHIPSLAENKVQDVPSTRRDVGASLAPFSTRQPSKQTVHASTTADSSVVAAGPCRYPYWVYTDTYRTRPATLGTGYPVGTDTSRMVVSSSDGAEYGVAASGESAHAGFSASGSRFVRSGWGFTWAWSGAQRSYRKGIRYQLMRKACYGQGYLSSPKFVWRPVGETGGTSSHKGLTRPGWNTCARVDRGRWRRDSSTGHAYSYGASVKMKDVIGLNLSIRRNYSSDQKLVYNLKKRRRLCGSTNYPAIASKVIDRILH